MSRTLSARTLIAGSLKRIGALAQGEVPSAAEEQDAFDRLNEFLDSLATQRFTMYSTARAVCPLALYEGVSAVVAAGGTSYAVNDTITVSGGVGRTAATFTVATLSGSAIATVTLLSAGRYTTKPTNPASTSSTQGGTGATLTITWSSAFADQEYTIGPTGDWIAVRPTALEDLGLILAALDPAVETLLSPLTGDSWTALRIKDLESPLPTAYLYTPTSPDATVTFYPVPTNTDNTIAIYTAVALTQFADLSTAVTLPPAYARMLSYNLAVELAPEFGRPLDPVIAMQARDSLAELKRLNVPMIDLAVDAGLTSGSGGYSIWSDT